MKNYIFLCSVNCFSLIFIAPVRDKHSAQHRQHEKKTTDAQLRVSVVFLLCCLCWAECFFSIMHQLAPLAVVLLRDFTFVFCILWPLCGVSHHWWLAFVELLMCKLIWCWRTVKVVPSLIFFRDNWCDIVVMLWWAQQHSVRLHAGFAVCTHPSHSLKTLIVTLNASFDELF